jgi:signal transduction histidine kinase/PleD family two-component response regulator
MSEHEKVNILMVDDQPAKLLSYEVILSELGENLLKASSGREALEHLLKTDIAIVLMDVSMPELDGFELAALIREHPRYQQTAIIFVSAVHLTDLDQLRGYAQGGVDYIAVPVIPEVLRAKVRVFADLYRKTQQLERLNLELEQGVAERTVALQQAYATEQRFQERTALLEVMQDITRAANESATSTEALQYAINRLCTYLGWPVGHVYLAVTSGVTRWAPTPIWYLDAPERLTVFQQATQTAELAAGEGMIGRVGALAKPEWSMDMATTLMHRQHAALEAGLQTGFAVPILVGPEVAGVLEFYTDALREIDHALLDALTQIGTQLGRAIEREQAAAQVQRQQEALLQREKLAAMGSLLAGVAHELNNPLAAILLQTDLLQEDPSPELLAEGIPEIAQAATRCARLVRQFLTLARQHAPERTTVDLQALITETMEMLMPSLRVENIAVDLRLAADLPLLWADPHQLQQVLVNLVTNAQQALSQWSLPRQLTLTAQVDSTRTRVKLEVTDTGPGIPLEIRARIFDPFFTTKPPGMGTGLGLSLCQGIIESHGGTIGVTSTPGQGTTFQIKLPVMGVSAPVEPSPDRSAAPLLLPHLAILLVDDEVSIANALARLLRRDGHTVETAANGQQALARLQERTYDLILSDWRMPEMDGPGLYQALAQQYPHLCRRTIVFTGDTMSPEVYAFFAEHDVPRLTKPVTIAAVRHAIVQTLRTAGPAAGHRRAPGAGTESQLRKEHARL